MSNVTITKHLRIYWRVQGVSYRAWSVEVALALNLTGWVRNRLDGSVEALVSGSEESVSHFLTACNKGPKLANVESIDICEGHNKNLESFEFRDTAQLQNG